MESVELVFERIAERIHASKEDMGEDFLMKTFAAFDTDGSGEVSYEEFKMGLRALGVKVPFSGGEGRALLDCSIVPLPFLYMNQ